jgi:hypothetical protein
MKIDYEFILNVEGEMNEIKRYILPVVDMISRNTFRNVQIVKIEGGLGSQILNSLEYFCREIVSPKTKLWMDKTYFTQKTGAGLLSDWSYQLTRYGINLSNFNDAPDLPRFLISRISRQDWVTPQIWNFIRKEFSSKFYFDSDAVQKRLRQLDIRSEFGVMHIRRGDYVHASSKIMSYQDNYQLLLSLKNSSLIPDDLIITSDSLVPPEYRNLFLNLGVRIHFLDDQRIDAGEMHDMMRSSQILITSNSTYSFSAGILAKPDCLVISPVDFFSETSKRNRALNNAFRSAGNFVIHRNSSLN